MTDDPEQIARGLSKEQREAVMSAAVTPPHPALPNYHAVVVPGTIRGPVIEQLEYRGVWRLTIRYGSRSHTDSYRGEMLPIGLAVRDIILREEGR